MKKPLSGRLVGLFTAFATLATATLIDASSSSQVEQLGLLAVPRTGHAATALADGRVLITGGRDSAGTIVATAEVFDPANQTSTAIGMLNTPRIDHTATLLADGRVLIAGGTSASGALKSAEIFDPANPGAGFRVISATMGAARAGHTATRLHDGTVLIAGGDDTGTAEIFKPTTESFSSTLLAMAAPRIGHTATLFSDDSVLLAGGNTDSMEYFSSVDQAFTLDPQKMTAARTGHDAIGLSDTRLLFFGGDTGHTIDEFNSSGDTLTLKATMDGAESSATLLANDKVLVLRPDAAGLYSPDATDQTTAFTAFDETSVPGSTALKRAGQTATELSGDKKILVAGGENAQHQPIHEIATFNPAQIWTDKDDYQPDDPVILSGSGWKPNENVYLYAVDNETEAWTYESTIAADANGEFVDSPYFIVELRHLGVQFHVTALGAQSTLQAAVDFTDANRQININAFSIISPAGAMDNVMNLNQTFTVRVQYTPAGSGNWTNLSATLAVPGGWTTSANQSLASSAAGTQVTFDWTVTPNSIVTSGTMSVSVTGTAPTGDTCNSCPFTSNLTVSSVNPAALTINSMTAAKNPVPPGGTLVKSGDSITVSMVVANSAASPRASANSVAPSTLTVNTTGTATGTCGAGAPASANISAATQTYTYTCSVTGGTGTLSFTGSASGTDQNSAAVVSTGNSTTNSITVDSTAPTISSVTGPANGTYGVGQALNFTVNYSENVTVTGTPTIPLTIGAAARTASYISGSGGTALVFRYTVQAGDNDSDGIASASPINLNGGTIQDAALNNAGLTFTPPVTTGVLVDTGAPTAAISYSPTGPVKSGTSLVITATFSEPMADSPVVKIAISGANTLAATNMTKVDSTHYTYTHTVGAGNGTATVALSAGTDVAGNVITSAPTSGANFTVDNTAPTAAITYSQTGPVNAGTSLVITATFNEPIADSPVMKIAISGANTLAATNMTKVDSTHYTYIHTVGAGDGTATVALSVGTDVAGNVITSAPTSGATFTVDNTPPGAPSTPDLSPGDDTGVSNTDNITNKTTNLTVGGNGGEANSPVDLFDNGSTSPLATTTANGGGNWSKAVNLAEGDHIITAQVRDAAGNKSASSGALSVTVDTTKPSVTINRAVGQSDPATAGPINFTVVFNEPAGTFPAASVSFAGSTAGGTLVATVTGGPTTFNVAVNGMTTAGNVVASVPAGGATDVAGNSNTASTSTDNSVEFTTTVNTTTTVTTSGTPSTYGDNVTFTAAVQAASGSNAPTGTVQFVIDGSNFGAPVTVGVCNPAAIRTACASISTSTLSHTGSPHTVSATYTPDTASFNTSNGSLGGGQTVNAKTLTASIVNDPTKPYDGNTTATLTSANFSLSGLVGTESFTVTQTSGTYNSKDVATANTVTAMLSAVDFTPTGGALASNYVLPTTASGPGHINAKNASVTADNKDKDYGDNNPALTATVVGEAAGGDAINYTLATTALKFSSIGDYAITVTLGSNPNYNVTKTDGNLHINAKNASVTADNKDKDYGDNNPALTATVVGEAAGGDAINYTLATTALKFSNVGDYAITVTLGSNPNYNVTKTDGNLHIKPKDASVTADNKGKTYGDDNPAFSATVVGEVIGGDAINYTLATTALKFSSIGDYVITVTLGSNPNYNVTKTDGNLHISPKDASVTADNKDKDYGDNNPALTATVVGEAAGGDAINYTLATTALKFSNVGNYPITVSLGSNPNYNVTATDGTLHINAKDASVTANNKDKDYGDNNPALTATVVGEAVGGDAINYTLATTALKFSNIGDYAITVTLGSNPNYNVTKTDGNLHISPKDASVTADNKGKTYGDDNPAFSATVVGEVVGGDAINYTLATTALKFSNIGDYAITVTLGSNPNYNVTKTDGNLHISPKDASVTADNKGKTYGDDNPAFSATVVGQVSGGDTINYTLTTTAMKFSNAGDYPITVTLGSNPNYNVTKTDGTLHISPKDASVTADNKGKIYGDDNPALTATVVGQVVGGTSINYTLATTALKLSGVGDYAITVTLGSNLNYNVTKTDGTLHISPKDASVTADNKSKTYGNDNPAFSATVVGQVSGGDTISYTLATTALKFSNASDYPITVTLGSNPNYNVTPHNGTLTVNKANQTISWSDPAAITLGTPLSAAQLNATVAGVAGGSAPGALNYTPAAGTVLGVGANQPLKVDAAATINYNDATKTVYINVNYSFVGFLQPIDNLPIVNSVKAGQTIPVKWQLKDAAGNLINDLSSLAPNGLQSGQIACSGGTPDTIEELASPGSTVFRFDGTQFIFNWQTSKSWVGTCRLMTVTLKDGKVYSAQFTFK